MNKKIPPIYAFLPLAPIALVLVPLIAIGLGAILVEGISSIGGAIGLLIALFCGAVLVAPAFNCLFTYIAIKNLDYDIKKSRIFVAISIVLNAFFYVAAGFLSFSLIYASSAYIPNAILTIVCLSSLILYIFVIRRIQSKIEHAGRSRVAAYNASMGKTVSGQQMPPEKEIDPWLTGNDNQ